MILVILACTLIGYLCGSAPIGLGVGVVFWALVVWVETIGSRRRKRIRRKR